MGAGEFLRKNSMNRIEILKGFLTQDPNDSFSRYALALEYVKSGQFSEAGQEFETVCHNDPAYVAAYFQLGQLYRSMGLAHEAERTFRTGITVAAKAGDEHTRSELEGALDSLLAGE
jgi:Tfp pilus assembly protein PilF